MPHVPPPVAAVKPLAALGSSLRPFDSGDGAPAGLLLAPGVWAMFDLLEELPVGSGNRLRGYGHCGEEYRKLETGWGCPSCV
jgi:hypothetical protein